MALSNIANLGLGHVDLMHRERWNNEDEERSQCYEENVPEGRVEAS
jgi:hypothetical protein